LGSINLTRFVTRPFAADAALDIPRIEERVRVAVRFLDNVIDVSGFPLAAQLHEAKAKRRIGLGITGLADALIMLGARYGSDRAEALAGDWMAAISRAAYLASTEIAREKGAFPLFERDLYLERPHIQAHDKEVRKAIAKHGIRNGCVTSIAPTGTISLFAGNVSSGIEPVFDFLTRRRILDAAGHAREEIPDQERQPRERGRRVVRKLGRGDREERPRRQGHPRLDGRRRVARVPRGQGPARRHVPQREVGANGNAKEADRRQLEDVQDDGRGHRPRRRDQEGL